MNESDNWLVHDHRSYDDALEECEMAVGTGEWKRAKSLFQEFVKDLKLHMKLEDEVLYPLILEESGDPDDVVSELSEEHDDLVKLVNDLSYIVKSNNFDHFLDSLTSLHALMNKHNSHEEAVFLQLGSKAMLLRRDEIMARMAEIQTREGGRAWKA